MEREKAPLLGIISMTVCDDDDSIELIGRCFTTIIGGREWIDTEKLRVDIPLVTNAASISFGSRYGKKLPGGVALNNFRLNIDKKEAENFDIQNRLILVYDNKYYGRFLYSFFDFKKGHNRNSRIVITDGIAMYFRQTKYNTMNFTVRDANIYDTEEGQKRILEAKKRSRALEQQDIILMYEKNCSRYEESASVLYEKLVDRGYSNVYYIVDANNPAVKNLPQKYRKNLVEKDSDRHLELFFASKKFISSETIDHALQLRVANKQAQDKITGKGLSYVFLQHGVMYMVSLNSKLRSGFRKKQGYKLHKTVVSSEAEARHFIDLADMDRDDLYVTGLAKFDKCYRNEGANKIIIMPTWRRWETNQAKIDIESTGYFKMIEAMYNAVPVSKRELVIILPHPLMAERFQNEKEGLGGHIKIGESYDLLLRECDLLITDYSSIAYDAFYRGANVVFYWKEKDECMDHYGENTHLMLNEDNCFGRICMNEEELTKAVEDLYGTGQSESDISKYSKIVEFHDGKNSERIIDNLIKDGMLVERN